MRYNKEEYRKFNKVKKIEEWRTCKGQCGKRKRLNAENFYKDSCGKYDSKCKVCRIEIQKNIYKKNREISLTNIAFGG